MKEKKMSNLDQNKQETTFNEEKKMNKINAVFFLQVKNANPNGDPNANNCPRQLDDDRGFITPECIMRWVRNAAAEAGENIHVHPDNILVDAINEAYENATKNSDNKKDNRKVSNDIVNELCDKYIDLRWRGGIFQLGNAKDISCKRTGPISISQVISIDTIDPYEVSGSKCCATTMKDVKIKKSKENDSGENEGEHLQKETGKYGISRSFVKYGLYKICISISPCLGKKTKLSEDDVKKFFNYFRKMTLTNHSTARPAGSITLIDGHFFTHSSELGDIQDANIYDAVNYKKKDGIEEEQNISDYELLPVTKFNNISYACESYYPKQQVVVDGSLYY